MANSYDQIYVHSIFSTKRRQSLILPHFEKRVWKYISGIGKQKGFPIIAIGGMADHLHVLISISPKISVSKTIQIIKGSSSKWINDNFYQERRNFQWQSGYSALSVSQSGLEKAIRYVRDQKSHHK
ncbi:MAG: IS200/IS605 family transposase [Bacteroidetes bacterium]|jgi:REP element-mobilizing transposase RayT|nr:IS200/IS605 family transposase [Bacteroidota bacterium]